MRFSILVASHKKGKNQRPESGQFVVPGWATKSCSTLAKGALEKQTATLADSFNINHEDLAAIPTKYLRIPQHFKIRISDSISYFKYTRFFDCKLDWSIRVHWCSKLINHLLGVQETEAMQIASRINEESLAVPCRPHVSLRRHQQQLRGS